MLVLVALALAAPALPPLAPPLPPTAHTSPQSSGRGLVGQCLDSLPRACWTCLEAVSWQSRTGLDGKWTRRRLNVSRRLVLKKSLCHGLVTL
jgi:hypothetical protein